MESSKVRPETILVTLEYEGQMLPLRGKNLLRWTFQLLETDARSMFKSYIRANEKLEFCYYRDDGMRRFIHSDSHLQSAISDTEKALTIYVDIAS